MTTVNVMQERADLPTASADGYQLVGRRVVVADDGSRGAKAAIRIAAELESAQGVVPHLLRVFDVGSLPFAGTVASMLAGADELLGSDAHAAARLEIVRSIVSVIGRPVDWPVHVQPGPPDGVIIREAVTNDAALIVMGLRRHGGLDRIARDETTLNVIRRAPCPVLAIAPSLTRPARSAIVGVDFTPGSIAAARVVTSVLQPGGSLVLAYVVDAAANPGGDDRPPRSRSDAEAALERVQERLAIPAGTAVVRIVHAAGHDASIAAALTGLAYEHRTDLIAVGSRRLAWIDRAFAGSVSTELVRDGRYSLLVASRTML